MMYEIKNNSIYFKYSNGITEKKTWFPYNNETDEKIIFFINLYRTATSTERGFATKYKTTTIDKFCYYIEVKRKTEINYLEIESSIKRSWENQLDHIVPISYGYKNNIPADLISSIENLQILSRIDNMLKSNRLTTKAKILLKKWGYE